MRAKRGATRGLSRNFRIDERRLKTVLAVFFLALAIPSVALVTQAYRQLRWEAFRTTQLLAEDLAGRIDENLRAAVAAEEARSFSDYQFLVVEGDAAANFVQRSPLSAFPVESAIPGAIGYFQVDAEGELTTPLLPATEADAERYGISADERRARLALEAAIRDVLVENRLVQRGDVRDGVGIVPLDDAIARARRTPSDEYRASVQRFGSSALQEEADAAGGSAPDVAPNNAPNIAPTVAPNVAVQAAFDRLRSGAETAVSERRPAMTSADFRGAPAGNSAEIVAGEASTPPVPTQVVQAEKTVRQTRVEQGLAPEPASAPVDRAAAFDGADLDREPSADRAYRVRMFESELDPFEVGVLDTGHIVMFRDAWRDGQRYIQGLVVDRDGFVSAAIASAFAGSSLDGIGRLVVSYGGNVLGSVGSGGETSALDRDAAGASAGAGASALGFAGTLLHRARLSPPFGELELVFGVDRLPRAPGSLLLGWVTLILAAVLCGGVLLMYRFGVGQIRLTRQQQDFVSAVSHELKTPLTSIRMYGEMLKAGWADDAKKQIYYDYIHGEAERLSRLIENVLQLARLTRNGETVELERIKAAELLDIVRSKIDSQVARAGFTLELRNDAPDAELLANADCFTQVMINLVDNALKFSAAAERKVVEIACRREREAGVLFTVRDFGPGIAKGQMKKIFELFYRPPNELTRETVGTGIGLALVRQLVTAMNGRVEVRNCSPGAEFRLSFAAADKG